MPPTQSEESDLDEPEEYKELKEQTWWDNMYDYITNHRKVWNSIIGFFVALAIAGIILISIYAKDASDNIGIMALSSAAAFCGIFFAIMVARMTRYGPKHVHLK